MKRAHRRRQGKSAFDLIEEATHLLRGASAATLAVYYLGAVPFVLGLLYFWADMSRAPFAHRHLAAAALGLAGLFYWMKFCQTLFTRRLRADISGTPVAGPGGRGCLRIFLQQAILQTYGLLVLPLALLPILPFAWVYAFFQNVTVLADGRDARVGGLIKKSQQQAALWPRQNILTLLILLAFALYVFLNWATLGLTLPNLCKSLFGLDSVFVQNSWAMLNTTFFAGMFGLTYLCVDPLLKTIYTLRCFYGESLTSGEDLKAELKPFTLPVPQAVGIMAVIALLALVPAAHAEAAPAATPPAAGQSISPPDLDHAIAQTILGTKYTWRMPKEQSVDDAANENVVTRFFYDVGQTVRTWATNTVKWIGKMLRKLFSGSGSNSGGDRGSGYGWIMSVEILLYVLIAVALSALAIFLYRVWRGRQRTPAKLAEAIPSVPDVADENVRADELPEDGWTRLARELLERGEFRLAMRAFYLASLAHLAARNLLSIARFKSNRDYERELKRRAHAFPALLSVFGENIFDFERVWYGRFEADRERVAEFAAKVERLKTAA
jgi:hypothetical protein